jgi:hypothetical protein
MVAEASVGAVIDMFITQTAWVIASLLCVLLLAKVWITLSKQKHRCNEITFPIQKSA